MTTAGTSGRLPRLRDRSGTEAAIVAAAERLLLSGGWSALNVQTVAAAAGVDRKLVYRYFDGVDGVIDRIASATEVQLGAAMAQAPPSEAVTYRAFAREMLTAYVAALRDQPLLLRLLAWELTEDTPLLRRLEARRSDVVQAWVRDRRPRLRESPQGDVVAMTGVLLAAIQHLCLASAARGRFAGIVLDDAGWARIDATIDRLVAAWPD